VASRQTSSQKARSRGSHSRNGSSAARNQSRKGTKAEREYRDYSLVDPKDIPDEPDVLLDVPVVKVDKIHFELDDLEAQVQLRAQVLDLVKLEVGAVARLGKVQLDIEGVEAQALLKVRLAHVTAIIDRVLTTLDRNPDLVKSLGRTLEQVGSGAGHAVGELGKGTGEAVEDVGQGAGSAVEDVGQGAGGAVQQVGQGAGQAVGDLGQGASHAVGQLGEGGGEALQGVGQGAGQAVGQVGQGAGQAVGEVGQGAGQAVGGLGQGAGQLAGQAGATVGQAGQELGGVAGQATGQNGGGVDVQATDAARKKAKELGLDLSQLKGTGANGNVTINDVRKAQQG
jgi:pyruvate/2-oxoglutarate dehydrogenase complex dihydrolipoamide acyltransferase (E2) component